MEQDLIKEKRFFLWNPDYARGDRSGNAYPEDCLYIEEGTALEVRWVKFDEEGQLVCARCVADEERGLNIENQLGGAEKEVVSSVKALAASARRVRPRLGPAAEADPPGAEAGGCGCCSPPVPGPPVAGPPVAGPPVPLERRRRPLGRGPRRQELWDDAGHFALSEAWRLSTLTAQSAQCSLPGHEGCNKSVAVGQNFNGDEARRLVMQWCIDGIGLTNREEHMKIRPSRTYTLSEIPSEQELLELVNGQTLA